MIITNISPHRIKFWEQNKKNWTRNTHLYKAESAKLFGRSRYGNGYTFSQWRHLCKGIDRMFGCIFYPGLPRDDIYRLKYT